MLFDTHCHIYDESYLEDIDTVLKESFDNGVTKMLIPGNTLEESIKAVEMANEYENIFADILNTCD